VACMQEPFGNAVHAATRVDLRAKRVAVLGCGPIGLMAIMVAKATGAEMIIASDPNKNKLELAKSFGADLTFSTLRDPGPGYDSELVQKIAQETGGVGVDVALEMAGYHTSVNTAIQTVRRGGDVILFGIKIGDINIKMFDRLIVRGVTMHSIIGRQIFKTWEITKQLLEDRSNGIQENLWNGLLNGGSGTLLPFADATTQTFEEHLLAHPKTVLKF
ncbi:MAG TPA: zinc-binding dehydrogenase, partial [Candidatus Paceibacterota bacterium]